MNHSALIQVSEAPTAALSDPLATTGRRALAADVTNNPRIDVVGPVFVIDDDDWVCDSLKVLLETYGFAVETHGSGAEFLADPRRDAAKCLVVDQHMPEIDGIEVIAALRREGNFLPVIVITGRLDAAIGRRAGALGVMAVLEKPFPAARLVDLVRSALGPQV
jgi:two-component system, LuxR family, response regulator FixJ